MEFKEREKYYIPIDGKLYETTREVYVAYYRMDRRERYLEERSRQKELSFDKLQELDFQIVSPYEADAKPTEEEAVSTIMIERMLKAVSELCDEERALIEGLFLLGKVR